MICKKCGEDNWDQAKFCTGCGAPLKEEAVVSAPVSQEAPALPMKWYNFLVKFALYAGVVLNAISVTSLAISILTGLGNLNLFYLFDAAVIAITVLAIVQALKAQKELAQFRQSGPASLYKLYVLNIISNAVNGVGLILAAIYIGVAPDFVSAVTNIVVPVVFLKCNQTYFTKRSNLFVN